MVYLWLLLGLFVLVVGAELLVRGAVSLAELARISPLVIGLTVVAFGTSAPELAVSSISSLKGDSAIALGNVVGSNIFNVLFILGLSALIVPLSVSSQLVKLDVPIMIIASIAAAMAAANGSISRFEGVIFLLCAVIYTAWLIRTGRKETANDESESTNSVAGKPIAVSRFVTASVNIGLIVGGLVLLVWGAKLLVDSATTIARGFGVSDMVIGLTIVAAGTSLPELATSIVAALKGQRDIAVGNVVGSNVFNLLVVLSTASVLSSSGVPVPQSVLSFDVAFMVGVAILCWPIFLTQAVVSRWEGALMLVLYVAYTGLLIADSVQLSWATTGKSALVFAVLPLVIAIVIVIAWLQRQRHFGTQGSADE